MADLPDVPENIRSVVNRRTGCITLKLRDYPGKTADEIRDICHREVDWAFDLVRQPYPEDAVAHYVGIAVDLSDDRP